MGACEKQSAGEKRWLICVPDENRAAVLQMCHASLMGNHPGIKLTLDHGHLSQILLLTWNVPRRRVVCQSLHHVRRSETTAGLLQSQNKAHHSSSIQRHSRVRPHRAREAWSDSFRKQVYPQHDRCLLRICCCCSHQQSESRTKHCFDYS